MKTDLAILETMSLEALEVACQSAFEEVETVFQLVEKNRNRLEYFGRLLTAAKAKVLSKWGHGHWEDWVTDTFQGRLPIRTAQRWMAVPKAPQMALLESGEVPRSSRKTGQVEVVESTREPDADPAPEPPTQRKTAAGSRRTPGAEKPNTRPLICVVRHGSATFAPAQVAPAFPSLSDIIRT